MNWLWRCSHHNRALCAKDRVYIHALVQNPDDLYLLTANLFVKDYMATLWKFTVALANFVASFADVWVFGK